VSTQTTQLNKRKSSKTSRSSLQKVQKVSAIKPQTVRGGGFLHYSRSIDNDASGSENKTINFDDFQSALRTSKERNRFIVDRQNFQTPNGKIIIFFKMWEQLQRQNRSILICI